MRTHIQKPDIVTVLENEGIELNRKGKSLWALCPLHSERTPSFKVDTENQSFFCFGCKKHGDSIAFIQKYKGLSFKDAISHLGIAPSKPSREAIQRAKREKHKHKLIKEFRYWCIRYADDVYSLYQDIQDAKAMVKTEEDAEAIAELYHMENMVLYESRVMDSNNDAAKFQLYLAIQEAKENENGF